MQLPIDTIEHNGEQFRISYNEWFTCNDCGESWENTTPDNPDETYRSEPKSSPTCPRCESGKDHEYVKRVHYYIKFAIGIEDPPLEAAPHAEALREKAREFEALEANGYEITQSDSVHVYFEKTEIESTDSDHEISGPLE